MSTLNRRQFLQRSQTTGLAAAAGLTILRNARSVYATPANNRLTLAARGAGGRGSNLAGDFTKRGDCVYAYVCDPDSKRGEALGKALPPNQGGAAPKVIQDYRKMLDDKTVDAVIVATPDHWHALAAINACQAGKDVYVEKPPTQNCWEGRQMIAAAKKYQRIMQVGTQNRSAHYNMEARRSTWPRASWARFTSADLRSEGLVQLPGQARQGSAAEA